jgi:zinc/manganese transport system substrate-binding protein
VVHDAHAEAIGQVVDRLLEAGIVEGDEPAALLTEQVMVVLAPWLRPFKPGLPLPELDALDQSVLDEELEHAVNARPAGGSALLAQGGFDLLRAEGARLLGQQLDHPLTRPTPLEAGARERGVHLLGPGRGVGVRHAAKVIPDPTRGENGSQHSNNETQSHLVVGWRAMRACPGHLRRAAALLLLAATVPVLSGCGEGITPSANAAPQVVAAENMWGSIAAQLAGGRAHVQSIITNPAEDPHSYEPTADDARALATAGLVVVNGIGYDPWASRLLSANPTPGRIVIDVGRLLHVGDGANPHRWYDPADVAVVARAITAALQRLDPHHAGSYESALTRFDGPGLSAYHQEIALIRRRYAGTPVGASESMFAMLSPALGLDLVTPPALMKAISEGTDVSAADTAKATRQITGHALRVWVLNSQNSTPAVTHLTSLARAHGIPVATITETLAPASASFQTWQVGQLRELAAALHRATGR